MKTQLSTIVETIHIDAPPEVVWRFLVDADCVPLWLGCMRYEGKVGTVFYMQMDQAKRHADVIDGATHCEILEITKPERFVFSWYVPGMPMTRVSFRLDPAEHKGTTVILEHSGWENFDATEILAIREALEGGWRSYVLPGFKATVEEAA